MVISHDRWFLDRIATHSIDYQDEGNITFFEGNFSEYEDYKTDVRRGSVAATSYEV